MAKNLHGGLYSRPNTSHKQDLETNSPHQHNIHYLCNIIYFQAICFMHLNMLLMLIAYLCNIVYAPLYCRLMKLYNQCYMVNIKVVKIIGWALYDKYEL